MKVAISGTRGIPNFYGGFEQFAEYLSQYLAERGHDVTVYSSHSHPYSKSEWKGVKLRHCYNPEDTLGTAGQFIYDFNCIMDARKQNYDIILQLGYSSNSIWSSLLPAGAVIVTNMDGLEWKRIKYSRPVRRFLKFAEKMAVSSSNYLVADSIAIREHLFSTYQAKSDYIPYGAVLFNDPDARTLQEFNVEPYRYDMLIARLEPENSIEAILEGFAASGQQRPFLVVGNHNNKFGEYLKRKFRPVPGIKFTGSIYDIRVLNNLRYYSQCYFHGHTVGGTNPSLLEAMASNAYICAHKNIFNHSILGHDAVYFETPADISFMIDRAGKTGQDVGAMICRNREKINSVYTWEKVNAAYELLLLSALSRFRSKLSLAGTFTDPRQVTV